MNERNYRVLVLASHPVPYSAPIFRLLAQHPRLEIQVAYCSLQGVEPALDKGFGIEVVWDVPLLSEYPWIQIPNRSPEPGLGHFFGLINLDLWNKIRTGKFDAVVAYTGYAYITFWIAVMAAKVSRTALLFGTDAHDFSSRDGSAWKVYLKKLLLPWIFSLADTVIVASSAGIKFISFLGIPEQRIQLTPYVVNNEWWIAQAKQVDRASVRQEWKIPEDAPILLFCAKLQPWKRPRDALHAFAKANVAGSYLVFAGEGPLRLELEAEAKALKIKEQVRFLGFVNQSQLPYVYRSVDLLVFPSQHEPFGVVVNEAMLCGCPVVVSDRVGARYDLIQNGETGFVYSCGDIDALAEIFRVCLANPKRLKQMSAAAIKQMEGWSPHENVKAFVQALEKSIG